MAAVLAVVIATFTWWNSRRVFKQQIVNQLFEDYSTKEMHDAIAALHKAFEKHAKCKDLEHVTWQEKRRWINHYKKEYRRDYRKKLHLQRRKLSTFYQKIAYFAQRSPYVSKIVRDMWGGKKLPMVLDIILPIETVAMPEILGHERFKVEPKPDEYAYPMWLLWKFWKRRPGMLFWRLRTFVSRTARDLIDPP
jgi:hypothetical protein